MPIEPSEINRINFENKMGEFQKDLQLLKENRDYWKKLYYELSSRYETLEEEVLRLKIQIK